VVKIYERLRGPNSLLQFFPANHRTRVLQQNLEDLERLFLQSDPGSVLAQLSSLLVQFEGSKAY